MLPALVVSVVAEGAKPVTPPAGTDVAMMVPEPLGAKLAPVPMRSVALVLVPPARFEKVPPVAERALRTALSVGMLVAEPGVPTEVTILRPAAKALPEVLAYWGTLPTIVKAGTVMPLPVPPPEPPPASMVQVLAGAQR